MTTGRLLGIALLTLGAVLLVLGANATDAPLERLSEAVTGRYSERTTWFLIGGAAAGAAGLALALFGGARR